MSVTRVLWPVPATFLPKTVEKVKKLSSTITNTTSQGVFHKGAIPPPSSVHTLLKHFGLFFQLPPAGRLCG